MAHITKKVSKAYTAWAKRGTTGAEKGKKKLAQHYAWAAKQPSGRLVATAEGVSFVADTKDQS